jgi:branched-chain amino acid transport system permease protein
MDFKNTSRKMEVGRFMTEIIQLILNCFVLSANYILLAVGLTLIFGILRTLNFAHGVFYILGGYVVYAFSSMMGVNYFLAIFIAMLVVGGVGMVTEATILYPLAHRVKVAALGAILGVSMLLEGIISFIFEGDDITIGSFFKGTVSIMGGTLSLERIMIVVLCGVVMLGVYLWIQRSRQGIAIRALAENERVANLQGINTRFIRFLVMGIASCTAAFAGAIVTPVFYINPFMGGAVVFKALLIVAVGGMGSIEGSILAGLLIGFVECIGVTYLGPIAEVVSFLMVIAVFLFRPRGLLGVAYEFH